MREGKWVRSSDYRNGACTVIGLVKRDDLAGRRARHSFTADVWFCCPEFYALNLFNMNGL
jgi:hypothetical protein